MRLVEKHSRIGNSHCLQSSGSDCLGRHDEAGDNNALDIVFPAMGWTLIGEKTHLQAVPHLFDAGDPVDVNFGNSDRLYERQIGQHIPLPMAQQAGQRSAVLSCAKISCSILNTSLRRQQFFPDTVNEGAI